jgi:RNA polymerase sigma-70 factor (ECF subfamily)
VWLTTIAHNVAVDTTRARKATPVDPDQLIGLMTAVTEGPERYALASEASRELRGALARLPKEQARALVMAGISGMTAQQIADAEHIPLGTAKTRIRAAMGKLRTALAAKRAGHE